MVHRRDHSPEPVNYREFKGHLFKERFRADIEIYIQQYRQQFKFWELVSNANAKAHKVLKCQWVSKYKTNKHGWFQKCKVRLVIFGNQQKRHDLPTKDTSKAITSFRVLPTLVAKFDIETLQLNTVNAFVHTYLDETVFMRMLPGYGKHCMVLKLNRALYGLRW